jgi:signal transduction histidine kinase
VQELLRASPLSAHARAQLGIVARNGVRLLRLVNAIMDFATAEAGRLRAAFRPTALGPRTADLASAFRAAAALAGLEYTVDVARVPPDVGVWVDRDKYEQVLCNLLSNALKYTRAGGVGVTAYVEHAAGRFVLEVRDTGVGVPPTELPRIFDKFYRVQSAAGAGVEGTGIGLSYTRELVRLHRGEISVESEVGVGSVFRVFLPLGREHLPQGGVVDDEPEEVGVDGWAPADSVRQCEALDGALEDGNKEVDFKVLFRDHCAHDLIGRPR